MELVLPDSVIDLDALVNTEARVVVAGLELVPLFSAKSTGSTNDTFSHGTLTFSCRRILSKEVLPNQPVLRCFMWYWLTSFLSITHKYVDGFTNEMVVLFLPTLLTVGDVGILKGLL